MNLRPPVYESKEAPEVPKRTVHRTKSDARRALEGYRCEPKETPTAPGARLFEREVVHDGRTVLVEKWKATAPSAGELLELQSGLGAPVLLEGGRLTVMAEGA